MPGPVQMLKKYLMEYQYRYICLYVLVFIIMII